MQKSGVLFVIVGGIVGIGIILSFYGNQVIFEDLIKGDAELNFGETLTVLAELDETETQTGIYAIQMINFHKGVTVKILNPFDEEIEFQDINEEVFEGGFEVKTSGTYRLIAENTGQEKIKIFGVIGPEPDAGKKSLGFISLYILIVGLIGMVGVTFYAIKNRRKSFS